MNIFEIKNYRYALQKTINELSEKAQGLIVGELKEKFKVRRNWFAPSSKFGVRVRYATKENLTAQIFTNAPWLPPHQKGGSVKPASAKSIAIPTNDHWDRGAVLRKSQRIGQMDKKTFFIKSSGGETLFLKRVGSRGLRKKRGRSAKGSRREPRSKLKVLFVLKKSVNLKKRLNFVETVESIFNRELSTVFSKNLSLAIKSLK